MTSQRDRLINRSLAHGPPVPVARAAPSVAVAGAAGEPPELAPGCVRDIDRSRREHRRITFQNAFPAGWKIKTGLVYPTIASGEQKYTELVTANTETSVASFDQYLKHGAVDWEATDGRPRHTCIRLANGHGQLWALVNPPASFTTSISTRPSSGWRFDKSGGAMQRLGRGLMPNR